MASYASLLIEWEWIVEISLDNKNEDLKHDVADLVITVFLMDGGRILLVLNLLFFCFLLFM